jgi:hypothetical protein
MVARPATVRPERRSRIAAMRHPQSGQWRCHCTLPASLPDAARNSPFKASRHEENH